MYKNNDKVPVALTMLDQWDFRHSEKLEMRMKRLAARAKAI
jgi:hypothetical protein